MKSPVNIIGIILCFSNASLRFRRPLLDYNRIAFRYENNELELVQFDSNCWPKCTFFEFPQCLRAYSEYDLRYFAKRIAMI